MGRKVIITCAVTGGADTVTRNPAIPVTPRAVADACLEAARAGAAVAHIHVRDPGTGRASMKLELYREVVGRVRDSGVDVVLNLTTGVGGNFVPSDSDPRTAATGTTVVSPEERLAHIIDLKPELCSLDMGSMNKAENTVFINTPKQLRAMARAIRDTGVKPELEVFEAGHVLLCEQLFAEGCIDPPPFVQICLGMDWLAPATPETMLYIRTLLPDGAVWSTFGKSLALFPMVAQGILLGGHVRVGLEDSLYIEKGVLASGNGPLVETAVTIISLLGAAPATPDEARRILGLRITAKH